MENNITNQEPSPVRQLWRALALVIAVPVVLLLPFADKAFEADEPLWVWCGNQILKNPADFYGFTVHWRFSEQPAHETIQAPPGAAYYAAPFLGLFGENERVLRIALILPALAVGLGTLFLARRLCGRPLTAALCVILTPVFLAGGTSILGGMLMTAFYVWAVVLWLWGMERRSHWLFAGAMVCALCSALSGYFGMTLTPLLGFYTLMRVRRTEWGMLWLLLPLLGMAAYEYYTFRLYGVGMIRQAVLLSHAFPPMEHLQHAPSFPGRMIAGLTFTGAGLVTALVFAPFLWNWRAGFATLCVSLFGVGVAAALVYSNAGYIAWPVMLQWVLFTMGGIFSLLMIVTDLRRSPSTDALLLALWAAGTFIITVCANWSISMGALLPMAPPLGVLLARRMDFDDWPSFSRFRVLAPFFVAAVVSLSAAWADFTWANAGREAVLRLESSAPPPPNQTYFLGHWGFQYYMTRTGARHVDYRRTRFVPGDRVIVAENNYNKEIVPSVWADRVDTVSVPVSRWASAMARPLSGFHSSMWGPLPFVFGFPATEKYSLYSVHTATPVKGALTFGRQPSLFEAAFD